MVTIDDIRKGIAENPELETSILTEFETKLPDFIKGKGFHVRTADEQTAWEKDFEEKTIKPRVSQIYGDLERDMLEAFKEFGITKEKPTEKVFELIKKAGLKVKIDLDSANQKLTDALAGKGDEVTKKQIEAYQKQVLDLEDQLKTVNEQYTGEKLAFKASQQVDKAFAKLTISVPANVAEAEKTDYVTAKQKQLFMLLSSQYKVKEEGGEIVFTDSEGVIQMNGTAVATAEDLLMKIDKYAFEPLKKGGSGGKGGKDAVVTQVRSKQEAYEQAAKEGLTQGSKEWLVRVTELAKANSIDLAA